MGLVHPYNLDKSICTFNVTAFFFFSFFAFVVFSMEMPVGRQCTLCSDAKIPKSCFWSKMG